MMKRALTIGIPAGLVVLIILFAVAFLWIDSIAKAAVERGATYALGVDTTLDSMDVGLLSGSVAMSELNVANPDGFDTDYFMHLGDGRVAVSLGSLTSERVVVPELSLSGLSMNLESKGGRANYKVIMGGMKRSESAPAESEASRGGGKKFIVEHAVISDVHVNVDLLPVGGKLTRMPMKIERIELRDIGSDSGGGVALAELSRLLTEAVLTTIVRAGGDALPGDIGRELNAGLSQLGGLGGASVQVVGEVTAQIGGEFKKLGAAGQAIVGEAAKDVGGVLDQTGKTIEHGLGKLLGGKKEEKDKP